MRNTRLFTLILAVAFVGCARKSEQLERTQSASESVAESKREKASPYGADGELLSGTEVVAGLPLPRGIERVRKEGRMHVFQTEVPTKKIQRYFGGRLVTGKVDALGEGFVYREAVARGARGGIVKLDVSIVPIDQTHTRVELLELPPETRTEANAQDVQRRLRNEAKFWD